MKLPQNIQDAFPVTPLQAGMLFHDIHSADASMYMQQYSFDVTGEFSAKDFIYIWMKVLGHHPALRSSFRWEGLSQPVQLVHKYLAMPCRYLDLRHLSVLDQEDRLAELARQDREAGFHLAQAPLFRFTLIRIGEREWHMLLAFHHIVADGWSLGLLFHDFHTCWEAVRVSGKAALSGTLEKLPAPSMKEYVFHLNRRDRKNALHWWQEALKDARQQPLPLGKASLHEQPDIAEPGRVEASLSREETETLHHAAKRGDVTLNVFFQAAWALVLAAYSGRRDILFASSSASRPPEERNIDRVFGPLLSVWPLRAGIGEQTASGFLRQLRDYVFSALEHDHIPLTELKGMLADGEQDFLNTMTVFENLPGGRAPEGEPRFAVRGAFEKTSYPLTVLGYPGTELGISLIYDAARYSEQEARGLAHAMRSCLLALARRPDLGVQEIIREIKSAGNEDVPAIAFGTQKDHPLLDPWALFDQRASAAPEDPAFLALETSRPSASEFSHAVVTYASLRDRAVQIAQHLTSLGFGRQKAAAIRLEAGADQFAAILAVWRLGGIWTPIPPLYPQRQATDILRDSGADILISTRALAGELFNGGEKKGISSVACLCIEDMEGQETLRDPGPAVPALPTDISCILYTSGSTGRPKGVLLTHANWGNRFHWMWNSFPFEDGEKACAKTTIAFADFTWEAFGALLAGKPVALPTSDQAKDPDCLSRIVEAYGVSRLVLTPSYLAMLLDLEGAIERLRGLRLLSLSGEALTPKLAARVLEVLPKTRLLNIYGSTELTADAAYYEISADSSAEWKEEMPLGLPLDNTIAAVVDENGQPMGLDQEGEIVFSGACLSKGYHNAPEVTEKAYVVLPALSAMPPLGLPADTLWFRTGDFGVVSPNGLLRYRGRSDTQIKIRGIRVEPEAAARLLEEHPSVKEAFVRGMPDKSGRKRLAAFITPAGNENEASVTGEFVEHWRSLYDDVYDKIANTSDITSDYHIWVNSYNGVRIPQPEMDEAMRETVRGILDLSPANLLEIGSGQGFLMFPLATHCASYTGVDNSAAVMAGLARHFGTVFENGRLKKNNITLLLSDADHLPDFEGKRFDVAVYNSVLQYFPNEEYLTKSLEQLIDRMEENGRIYLGDVRNLDIQDYFRMSLLLHEYTMNGEDLAAVDVHSRLAIAAHSEGELLISPNYFRLLPDLLDRVAGVTVHPKRGHADNELTRFRYEAVLYLDSYPLREYSGPQLNWVGEENADLEKLLAEQLRGRESILLRDVPQKRLLPFVNFAWALDNALSAGKMYTPASALLKAEPLHKRGFTREELHLLGARLGCQTEVYYAADGASMDVIFHSGTGPVPIISHAGRVGREHPLTNAPTRNRFETFLKKTLSGYLATSLSEPMRPEALLFSENWPRTVSGKIDLKRLPNPFLRESAALGGLPKAGLEKELAEVWQQTLGLKQTGREDNFFRIGGNSLSITQLAFSLRRRFQCDVGFRELYQVPRFKDMAAYLEKYLSDASNESHVAVPLMGVEPGQIEKDLHLADGHVPCSCDMPAPLEPGSRIFMTGAPGQIGLWLLAGLLERKDLTVTCLTGPEDVGLAHESLSPPLVGRMMAAGCWKEDYRESLHLLDGNLEQERFGLSVQTWDALAADADLVLHSGLHVNLAQSYSFLRRANVLGTVEVIRFCCDQKLKPLHFIGSLSVIDHTARTNPTEPVKEDDPFDSYAGLTSGYILTRWVMDQMVRRASSRGLPTALYRFTTVSGDTVGHRCDTGEIYWRLLRYCCKSGALPAGKRKVDMLPVDVAANMALTIAASPACYGKAYHICNPEPEPWSVWENYLRRLGHQVETLPASEWASRLQKLPETEHDDNSRILLSMASKDGYDPIQALNIDMQNTLDRLNTKGFVIPRFSFEHFKACHEVMVREGWLPVPGLLSPAFGAGSGVLLSATGEAV